MCEKCRDTGWIMYEENGYTMSRACECREKMLTEIRLRKSGISEAFRKRTLDNYDTRGIKALEVAKKTATNYIEHFLENEKETANSIMFLGNPGTGKTHLSLAIANYLLNEKGVSCLYMPYRETMTELKQLREDKYKFDEKMYQLTTARLLIIDDLYKGTVTDADLNYMFQIVNQRYLNSLPFICSSEKQPMQLIEFDEAIGSRLLEQAKGNIITFNDKKLNYRIYN